MEQRLKDCIILSRVHFGVCIHGDETESIFDRSSFFPRLLLRRNC